MKREDHMDYLKWTSPAVAADGALAHHEPPRLSLDR
jgi:hypothetical protein